ncbi:MAG TPA: serine/threonine-protein kinase, partial [Gemmataceae bacterium]|nr:serine/threonine-protein kinase [Gemmataceae bacterium]
AGLLPFAQIAADRDPMSGRSAHTPIQNHPTATIDLASAGEPSARQALPIKLAHSDGSLPRLTGEIRDLVYVRLREVAFLVTGGWAVMLLLCLSGLDGLFNASNLGTACVAAMGVATAAFVVCWVSLRGGPRHPLARLRAFEAVYMWGSVACAAWLRYAAVGYALGRSPPDRFMVLYAGALSGLIWMAVFVIYGIFAPNTWRRLLGVTAAALAVLLGVEVATWAGRLSADPGLFVSYLLITLLAVFLGAGIALYGSFKIGTAREEAAAARQQLRELGRYRLTRRLGAGAMGEVYLAEHTLLRRPCAVKLIRPGGTGEERQVARFEREVQATAKLTHPNTVEIYDYGTAEDGTFYYAMEYLPGLNLDQLVTRHGPLPAVRVVHLLRQVCGALREAHGVGLIHRDIKPANMIVCSRGGVHDVVKLLDFGLVWVADPSAGRLTQDGSVAGTPEYMSPEQAEGEAEPDGRSDIYNLGCVAYFLLTGRPPFQKAAVLQLLYAHVREPVRPPSEMRPEIPAELEGVVLRCLEKDRGRRYQNVSALDQALAACGPAESWTEVQAADWWNRHPAGATDLPAGESDASASTIG